MPQVGHKMSDSKQQVCASLLTTSIALIEQFASSLESSATSVGTPAPLPENPSSLLLLTAASNSLKSTTTKLSLLVITAPFTHSAVSSLLKPLTESILPSLVTAALLTTPQSYPDAFSAECSSLVERTLQELSLLLRLVEKRSKQIDTKSEIRVEDKQEVTESTGRVWELCDAVVKFADDDVSGFVVRKANQWLALMKDAVQELQDWDPEEEVDPDDIFGVAGSDEEDNDENGDDSPDNKDRATISAGVKDQVLKVLSRVPQSIHVVVKQRLEKLPLKPKEKEMTLSKQHKDNLNLVLKRTRDISECIDESAEAMYMGDLELCLKKAGEARALTIEVVESVMEPWVTSENSHDETKEDKYIQRALLWIQQVGSEDPKNGTKGAAARDINSRATGVT